MYNFFICVFCTVVVVVIITFLMKKKTEVCAHKMMTTDNEIPTNDKMIYYNFFCLYLIFAYRLELKEKNRKLFFRLQVAFLKFILTSCYWLRMCEEFYFIFLIIHF